MTEPTALAKDSGKPSIIGGDDAIAFEKRRMKVEDEWKERQERIKREGHTVKELEFLISSNEMVLRLKEQEVIDIKMKLKDLKEEYRTKKGIEWESLENR